MPQGSKNMSQKNSLNRVKTEIKDGRFLVLVDNKVVYREFAKLTKEEQKEFADCKKAIKKLCKTQNVKDPEHHVQYVVKFVVFCMKTSLKFDVIVDSCAFQFVNLPSSLSWLQKGNIPICGIQELFLNSKKYADIITELKKIEKKVNLYSDALKDSIYKEYCYL